MKMKKLARVFTSAVLVSAMVATMGGMTSFAAPSEGATVTLTKKVNKPENVYAPRVDFKFQIGDGIEVTGAKIGTAPVSVPQNVLKFVGSENVTVTDDGKTATIASKPNEDTLASPVAEVGTISFASVSKDQFPAPGTYRYPITELEAEGKGAEGIMEDNAVNRYMDIIVKSTDEAPSFVFVEEKEEGGNITYVKSDGVFLNGYGKTPGTDPTDPKEPKDKLYNLEIEKKVEGNQGNKSEEFSFAVQIDGETGEEYYVSFDGIEQNITKIESGKSQTFNLKDGAKVKITGLSEGDKYTVSEESTNGYTTKIRVNDGEEKDGNSVESAVDEKLTSDTKIVVTNTKDVTTPTGIVLSFAPYILLVALAGVFGVLFLRRKKEEF